MRHHRQSGHVCGSRDGAPTILNQLLQPSTRRANFTFFLNKLREAVKIMWLLRQNALAAATCKRLNLLQCRVMIGGCLQIAFSFSRSF